MTYIPQGGGAPTVVTGSQAGLWQALASGLPSQNQAAVQAQLAVMAKKAGNLRYVKEALIKEASALTNGVKTQPYTLSTPLVFSMPQPNNAYIRGIIVRTILNYTVVDPDADAVFGLTAAGSLGIYDTIEVRYNKSQIKIRPYDLRLLAQAGALDWPNVPQKASTDANRVEIATLANYLTQGMSVVVGAQSLKSDIWIPFNILSDREDRGFLPSMPGETGVQVICNTPVGLLGQDPIQNCIASGNFADTADEGVTVQNTSTVQVIAMYSDGETTVMPTALPYDMSVLNGTIQMQLDNPLTNLQPGSANINRGKLNILGQHQYVILHVIDGLQSNKCSTIANMVYLSSDKDDVGANSFWRYGLGTNLDINEFFAKERITHNNVDVDEGNIFMVEAPITGETVPGARDGTQWLDNTTAGWPAWHYGISLTALGSFAVNGINPRIEAFTVYVNSVGLAPVGY